MTGSTKTVADVQEELNEVSTKMSVPTFLFLKFTVLTFLLFSRTLEKEKQVDITERDRLQNVLRSFESKCHQLELEEQKSLNKLNEMNATSERLEQARKEVTSLSAQIKVCSFTDCMVLVLTLVGRNWTRKLERLKALSRIWRVN